MISHLPPHTALDTSGIGNSSREDATQDLTPGQQANRTAVALAGQLGTTVVDFPGDHGGFVALPEQCGRVLDQVLTETT